MAEFLPNIIYKDIGLTQALLQEDFKFSSNRGHQGFGLNLLFVLLPPIQSSLFEKHNSKNNSVAISELEYGEIVFALQYEVIAIYVRLTFVDV